MYIASANDQGETAYQLAEEVHFQAVSGESYTVLQPTSADVPRTRKQIELLINDYRKNAKYALDLADRYQILLDEIPEQ